MNICNKPPNKTAPEKSDETALEVHSQCARRNGWSWPPHPFQFIAWLLYLFYALIGFGILVPLLPVHWVPAGYIVSIKRLIFRCLLQAHLSPVNGEVIAVSWAGGEFLVTKVEEYFCHHLTLSLVFMNVEG